MLQRKLRNDIHEPRSLSGQLWRGKSKASRLNKTIFFITRSNNGRYDTNKAESQKIDIVTLMTAVLQFKNLRQR